MPKLHITTPEMEIALSQFLRYRVNLIVPNVGWGMNMHECDLLVVSKAGYLTEIEIKITRADLRRDLKKRHLHKSPRIKRLFFALPDYLESCQHMVPERAGIILVSAADRASTYPYSCGCRRIRAAVTNKAAGKITDYDRYKIARLGALRIWDLKRKLL